jgi:crossover junction endodeoxyribonuclease RuvC
MTTTTIGIDPGLGGAFALLHNGRLSELADMPTIEVRGKRRIATADVRDILIGFGPVDHVVIEDVQGVQGSGATGAFTFGRGVGILEGVCVALARPITYVTPQRWTKAMGVSRDKGSHRQAAQRLWPDHADRFARVKDDGRADAALIAYWHWRVAES